MVPAVTYSQRSLVAFLVLFLLAVAAPAQQHLSFEKINYRQGLSHQNIRCIFKDRQGFLWIGTDFGLNRYDGISFKKWFHIDGDSNSLPHNIVNSITQDAEGFIWIGTSKGVARMNPYTGRFLLYNDYSGAFASKSNYDLTVFADSADRIWIGNEKGIYILDKNRKLLRYIKLQLEPEGKRLNNYVYDFVEVDRFVYVSTSYGLYRINKIDFSATHYLLKVQAGEDPNRNAITRLSKDKNGIIWAGSWFAGIVWFNPQTQIIQRRFIVNTKDKNIVGENVIMDVEAVSENGKIFIYASSYNGLLKIDASSVTDQEIRYQQYLPDKNDRDAIDRQYLSILYKDDLNNLWIATATGLNKVKIVPGLFRTYSFEKIVKADFPPYNIVPAATPGTWWIQAGPNNVLFNPATNQFTLHPFREEKYSLRQLIKAGNEYFIASKYGLLHFDSYMQLIHVYDTTNTPSLHTQHFNKVFCDSRGNIWLGTYRRGIVLFNQLQKTFTSYLHDAGQPINMEGHDTESFFEDDHGIIWIATSIGAIQFDYNTEQFAKTEMCGPGNTDDCNMVQCFCQGTNGNLYIGSRDGLYLYDYSIRQAKRIPLNGQGISNRIHDILEDKHQCLWLCTNSGLLWYDPKSLQKRLYSEKDGLPQEGLENAFYKTSDSSFWIGTENAITAFNPLQVQQTSKMPVPVLASVNIDDNPFSLIDNKTPLSIAYDQSIGVDFLSLNYFNTAQNQYQYIVEGLDDHWKNIGNEHTLRFSNLPSGNYTLKIKAANSDGIWNDEPLVLSFTATPPFYKTWWFISLSIVAIAVAVYLLYHYRLQQAIKLERIRTRIATDLHDDIGATLSSISMYSDAVKNQVKDKLPHLEQVLEKMGENSRSMVSSMSDIVWAINPGNDEGEKLVHRMESYARDICAIKNVPLNFSAGGRINHVNLSLEHKKNIYLIFKESLNNALKYAGAKHISVSIELTGNTIRLMIKDDGKGFNLNEVRKGNGLKNIQARSQEIGAAFLLTSEPGKGTSVELSCMI